MFENNASKSGKQYRIYLGFLESIREKKKSIIISPDYVVLSKPAYDALVERAPIEYKSIAYDEFKANTWIERAFLERKDK